MKYPKIKLVISVLLSLVCLAAVFVLPGASALAEEGDNVTDNTTVYYDIDGNILDNPFDEELCYDIDGNVIDCPTEDEEEEPEDTDTDDADNGTKSIPPGQLVRRGVSGPIIEVGDGYIVIETNFGPVKVYTDEDVDESMIGERVAVKLSNRERTTTSTSAGDSSDNASDNSTATVQSQYFREADAEQFKIIPSKSTKEHRWGTVESTDEGCFLVDDEGNQIPVACGNTTDMIGLTDTSENSTDGTPVLLGTEDGSKIQERIQARIAKAEEEGDEKTLARLQTQLERYESKQLERLEKKESRIAAKAERDKGKPDNKGNAAKEDKGKSDKTNQGNAGGNKDK